VCTDVYSSALYGCLESAGPALSRLPRARCT